MKIDLDFNNYGLILTVNHTEDPVVGLRLKIDESLLDFEKLDKETETAFRLELNHLLDFNSFENALLEYDCASGSSGNLALSDADISFDELLIKGRDDFWKRVDSPARVIKNQFVLRHCCKRAVALFPNDFNVLGASLCALGYRILDLEDPADQDVDWFEQHTEKLFNWIAPIDAGEEARWVSSVAILNAYKELNRGRTEYVQRFLEKCLHYRNMVKYRPMIQINIARAFFLLADIKVKSGLFDEAITLFSQIDRVAIEGVVFSDLNSPKFGRFKFTEFIACMRAVKESRVAIRGLEKLIEQNQKASSIYNIGALYGYVSTLHKRGKI